MCTALTYVQQVKSRYESELLRKTNVVSMSSRGAIVRRIGICHHVHPA